MVRDDVSTEKYDWFVASMTIFMTFCHCQIVEFFVYRRGSRAPCTVWILHFHHWNHKLHFNHSSIQAYPRVVRFPNIFFLKSRRHFRSHEFQTDSCFSLVVSIKAPNGLLCWLNKLWLQSMFILLDRTYACLALQDKGPVNRFQLARTLVLDRYDT